MVVIYDICLKAAWLGSCKHRSGEVPYAGLYVTALQTSKSDPFFQNWLFSSE